MDRARFGRPPYARAQQGGRHSGRYLERSLAIPLDDAVGDEVEQPALLGLEVGLLEAALCVGDDLQRLGPDPFERARRGDPVAERLGRD